MEKSKKTLAEELKPKKNDLVDSGQDRPMPTELNDPVWKNDTKVSGKLYKRGELCTAKGTDLKALKNHGLIEMAKEHAAKWPSKKSVKKKSKSLDEEREKKMDDEKAKTK